MLKIRFQIWHILLRDGFKVKILLKLSHLYLRNLNKIERMYNFHFLVLQLNINLKEVKVDDNVKCDFIAKKLTGYSGADITNVCRDASMMSMRRKIAGLKPSEIRNLDRDELDLPVTKQDFLEAISKCNKSVSKEDLEKYEKWMEEFGSS